MTNDRFKANGTTLAPFFKKVVAINVMREDGDDHEVVQGRVEAISDLAIIIRTRGGSEVITNSWILDAPSIVPPRKNSRVIVRKLRPLETTVRQHLVDRHGLAVDLTNSLTEGQAITYHDRIDHSNLGHRHIAADPEEV
jgi:hypothetical protein